MKNIAIVIGLLLSILSLQCEYLSAYNEPDNFAGLKFGEDLTKRIKRCPEDDWLNSYAKGRPLCYNDFENYYTLSHGPDLPGVTHFQVYQLGGKLAHVWFGFGNLAVLDLLAIFEQRYGAPTERHVESWISRGGVRTTSRSVSWVGKSVSIFFVERGFEIDKGYISYETPDWSRYQKQKEKEAIKKGASGL